MARQNAADKSKTNRPQKARSKATTKYSVNKNRGLRFGSISFPLNDSAGYKAALKAKQIFPITQLAHTLMRKAIRDRLLNKVVFGVSGHTVVEGIMLDEKSGFPWQIEKVRVKFQHVDYRAVKQPYTEEQSKTKKELLSPKAIRFGPRIKIDRHTGSLDAGSTITKTESQSR